ncbi:MAG: 2-oxoacid:acceptor oxidoreductase family protein, partial [Candidatus Pacebacteria bacterium]|nr:2-oxoacid:acceptor oxidoreductase family protein [Candidatus Paceibacterota bacterium]
GIQDRSVLLRPVGCSVFAYYYVDCGNIQVSHGRAPAVGAAVRRSTQDAIIISYQGDGDLCSIGFNQTFQAANRGDGMAVFFVNNAVYGMTGGQMAPTTLIGQKTTTSPRGRTAVNDGYPVRACEVLDTLDAPVYIERCSLADSKRVQKARRAVRKALQIQKENKGYAFVEFLSPCPTNAKLSAVETADFVTEHMEKVFPLGCFRDRSNDVESMDRVKRSFDMKALDDVFFAEGIATEGAAGLQRPPYTMRRIKVAGFGGQGVLSLGLMLAEVGQRANLSVTWFPSYGPEQRGGTANCSVVLSGTEIGSPVVSEADILVAMNQPSLERFGDSVVDGGIIFYDASVNGFAVREGVQSVAVPAFEMAAEHGVARAANTVMLGVIAASGVCEIPEEAFLAVVNRTFTSKPKVLDANRKVFNGAVDWARRGTLAT